MYLNIQKLPLFKPNLNLSNDQILFIVDNFNHHLFDSYIDMSGSHFDYDRELVPYLITEHYGNITIRHHLAQEYNKNKFNPLMLLNTEWITKNNEFESILNVPQIAYLRDEADLEHSYINTFDTALNIYDSFPTIYDINLDEYDTNKLNAILNSSDKFTLAEIQLNDYKRRHPYFRNTGYIGDQYFRFIEDINSWISGYDVPDGLTINSLPIVNGIIIDNAFSTIPNIPNNSVILNLLRNKDKPRACLTKNDLNKIISMFPNRDIIEKKTKDNGNNILPTDLTIDQTSVIVLSEINNILNNVPSLNYQLILVKNKDTNTFSYLRCLTPDNDKLIESKIDKFIKSSSIQTYITDLGRIFNFFLKIDRIKIYKQDGFITIEFCLNDGTYKQFTYNILTSIIATSALHSAD